MNNKEKFILFTSALGLFLYSMDSSLMNLTQPLIAQFFGTGTSEVSFISTAYLVAAGSSLLICAQIFEIFDFKKVLLTGYLFFILATLSCGLSRNIWILIFFRAIQGFGGAAIFIGAFTAVSKFLPVKKMGMSLGVLSASLSGGMAAGFPIGGLLTSVFSWQAIFFIQIPFIIIGIILTWFAFNSVQVKTDKFKFDFIGCLLFFLALAFLTFSMSMNENFGTKSLIILGGFFIFAMLFSLFIIRELKCSRPLINLTIFKDKTYSLIISGRIMATILQSGNLFLLPFYLIYITHLSQTEAGLVMLSYTIIYTILAPFPGHLADRFKPERVGFVALIILLFACVFFLLMSNNPGIIWIIAFLFLVSIGFAVFFPSNNKLSILFVTSDKRGLATGIMLTVWAIGQSLGVSVFELVFSNSLYFSKFSSLSVKGEFSRLSSDILISGFRFAYLSGVITILFSIIFTVFALSAMMKAQNKRILIWRDHAG